MSQLSLIDYVMTRFATQLGRKRLVAKENVTIVVELDPLADLAHSFFLVPRRIVNAEFIFFTIYWVALSVSRESNLSV